MTIADMGLEAKVTVKVKVKVKVMGNRLTRSVRPRSRTAYFLVASKVTSVVVANCL